MGAANPGLVDRLVRASSRACRGMPDARDTVGNLPYIAGAGRGSGAASQSRTKIVSDTSWHRVAEASSSAACGSALEGKHAERFVRKLECRWTQGQARWRSRLHGFCRGHIGFEALGWRSMKRSCVRFINAVMGCDDYFTPSVA